MWAWSYVLMAVGVFGLYLAGRKSKWGWAVGIAAQVLWIAYAIATQQWGFIISAIAYGAVYIKNFVTWRREEAPVSQPFTETLKEIVTDIKALGYDWAVDADSLDQAVLVYIYTDIDGYYQVLDELCNVRLKYIDEVSMDFRLYPKEGR